MPYLLPEDEHDRRLLRRFGVELRRCRLATGLSQTTLAERSGVSQSTISRLENGTAPAASVFKLLRMGSVLGSGLPLAFCPHRHACGWGRLNDDGIADQHREPVVADDYLERLMAGD